MPPPQHLFCGQTDTPHKQPVPRSCSGTCSSAAGSSLGPWVQEPFWCDPAAQADCRVAVVWHPEPARALAGAGKEQSPEAGGLTAPGHHGLRAGGQE